VIAWGGSSGEDASAQRWGVLTRGRSDRQRARAAGSLYLTGSALGFVSLALFTGSEADRTGLAVTLGVAGLVGLGLVRFGRRLPLWAYQPVPALGTVLICALLYYRHEGIGAYAYFFIWVGLWSFYFLALTPAVAQVVLIALLFGGELIVGAAGPSATEHWLLVVGTVAASGLLVSQLAGQLQRRMDQMGQLLAAAHELSEVTDAAGSRPIICRAILRVSDGALSVLYEPNADGSALLLTASAGTDLPRKSLPFVGEHSNTVTAFTTAQPVFVGRLADDPNSNRDLLKATGMASGLWQPVIRHGRPVGVLGVLWANGLERLPGGLHDLIALLAADAATTIERADLMGRLESVARTDDLTGLLNRRAWSEELPRELSLAARAGQPLTMLMLDLDNFKAYNDTHGHLSGDRLLKRFAGAWTARLRETDLLARYGGEEFTVVLPGCGLAEGLALADTLREVRPDAETCSVGVALWDGKETADELVDRADKALYEAKRLGRDRSETAL
jgi:diguanylate cyclase (GGDEF)-like protein